ncbi:hypothetical protein [Nonomuraea sp. CA-141351]|uniref:hypothetical protein n=1 Tax=Nonomuraea sp. CA-141351 TaxID=3239996 RepID=UPI003D8AA28A
MTRHVAENRPVGVRRMMLFTLAVVVPGIIAMSSAPAHAMAIHGPPNWGNGKHNKNYVAVKSPTIMHGAQQISVSISSRTKTQAAFCKRRAWTCKISQRIGY